MSSGHLANETSPALQADPRPNGDPPRITKTYVFLISIGSLMAFLTTLLVPYWYDQGNEHEFTEAEKTGRLLVREYMTPVLNEALRRATASQPTVPPSQIALTFVQDKRLISLDYIQQMHAARQVETPAFVAFTVTVSLLLFVMIVVIGLTSISHPLIRTLLIGLTFFAALLAIQLVGLPHTNKKFHVIVGLIYAILLALSDFLSTLKSNVTEGKVTGASPSSTGYLSSLQYKHRFWTVVFNLSVVTVLTLIATTSFKVFEVFIAVFGESFVVKPLVGLLITVGVALLITFIGILRPIRAQMANIERAMAEL